MLLFCPVSFRMVHLFNTEIEKSYFEISVKYNKKRAFTPFLILRFIVLMNMFCNSFMSLPGMQL
jgi:hypothetical protein